MPTKKVKAVVNHADLSPKQRLKPVVDPSRVMGELTGTIDAVQVAPDHALVSLTTATETVHLLLYSDGAAPTSISPRDAMWRGAILGLAQRALTNHQSVTMATQEVAGSLENMPVVALMTLHPAKTE